MILSATKWTPKIKKFVFLAMYDPFICIASFIEAVVFKSLRPKLYLLRSTYKNQKILGKVTACNQRLFNATHIKFLFNFVRYIEGWLYCTKDYGGLYKRWRSRTFKRMFNSYETNFTDPWKYEVVQYTQYVNYFIIILNMFYISLSLLYMLYFNNI